MNAEKNISKVQIILSGETANTQLIEDKSVISSSLDTPILKLHSCKGKPSIITQKWDELLQYQNGLQDCKAKHSIITQKCLNCGRTWIAELSCGDKLCPICALKRSNKHSAIVYSILSTLGLLNRATRLKFVTLTIKNVDSVAFGYYKLRDCFGKLQRRAIWRKSSYGRVNKNGERHTGWCVRGGFGNFEVTNAGCGYHVHLHLLLDADFIPQKQLSKLWHQITGDSYIVDVRACSGTAEAIAEITKYSFKPADAVLWTDGMKQDFNAALKNKVLFFRFGSWRNVHLAKKSVVCGFCGSDLVITLDFENPDAASLIADNCLYATQRYTESDGFG